MFNKKDTYLLCFLDKSFIRLEDSQGAEIFTCPIYKDENSSIDFDQVEYLLKKTLASIDLKSNIVIRISDSSNIFRFEKAPGLKEGDLDGYYSYNVEKILPFSRDNLLIKYDYWRENFLLFGLDKEILNLIHKKLLDLGFENIFVTTFASELLAYLENEKDQEALALRLDRSSLELIQVKDSDIVFYKYKTISPETFNKDIEALAKSVSISDREKLYIFADKKYINEEKDFIDQSFSREFSYKTFAIDAYMEV